MLKKIIDTFHWLPFYVKHALKNSSNNKPKHIYFCICDHYEPYWGGVGSKIARKRINTWLNEYPKVAEKFLDSDGRPLKYSFFYPEEEYKYEDMNALAGLCHAGFGEAEIHLHHDNDTAENLRNTLTEFKKRLHYDHGLLSTDRHTGDISYGFIHGNWALDNSRPDGRWCGVNNEIDILQETGCYADFTMPSAPSDTQTRKVNSIYYAIDDPQKPKSHDMGLDAEVGKINKGLLMVQGPLSLAWWHRKYGLVPRIENSGLMANIPVTKDRVRSWINQHVHVQGAGEHVFVKLYTHGTQEAISDQFFNKGGLAEVLSLMKQVAEESTAQLYFVSAREMVNIIEVLVKDRNEGCLNMRDYRNCFGLSP